MYFKEIVFCAVLLIQTISGQCGCKTGNPGIILAAPACGCLNARQYAPSICAASLTISPCPLASAPNIPAGMSVASDNLLITGPVIAAGKLPFAGTVALEGALPAYGAGAVSYGCGDVVAIVSDAPVAGSYVSNGCGCSGKLY